MDGTNVTTTTATQVNPNFSINVGSPNTSFSAGGTDQFASPSNVYTPATQTTINPDGSVSTIDLNVKYLLIGGAALALLYVLYRRSQ